MNPRSTVPFFWLAVLGLAATVAAQPREPETLRFVYLFSERPAAHLIVSLTDPRTAGTTRSILGDGGLLALPEGDRSLELRDPQSGLVLFALNSIATWERPAEGVVRLPLPVRVIGALRGFGDEPAAIDVHHGSGPRISVSDFQRREHGLRFQHFDGENAAWGLELPAIASRWGITRPRLDLSFDTGWIAVVAPPQLAVRDREGRVATLEVPLPPAISAHAVLSAGTITPAASATIELDRSALPATDLPLLLRASLETAAVPAGSETAAGLHLALLEVLDPRAAHFALRRAEIPLELTGVTRIAGLPPFVNAGLVVAGPTPGLAVRSSLAAGTGGTARLGLAADLLTAVRRVPLGGLVLSAGGAPIPGATVVVSSYPDRIETRTGADGRFSVPSAAAGREAVVFVDAPVGGEKPFDRVTVSRRIEVPADGGGGVDITIEVPRPAAFDSGSVITCPGGQSRTATEPIAYTFAECGAVYTQSEQLEFCPILGASRRESGVLVVSEVTVSEIRVNPAGGEAVAVVEVPRTGEYTFILSYTPFVYARAVAWLSDLKPVDIYFQPPAPWKSEVLAVSNRFGNPAAGVEVAFPNWIEAADAYNGLASSLGTLKIDCFTLDPVPAFVASPADGCFEGAVRLRERGANIVLGSCDGF